MSPPQLSITPAYKIVILKMENFKKTFLDFSITATAVINETSFYETVHYVYKIIYFYKF